MGWLLKTMCALILLGIFALCFLSVLGIAAAIILPNLMQSQVHLSGGIPFLPDGHFGVTLVDSPYWHSLGLDGGRPLAFACAVLAFMVLLCCAALFLGGYLFSSPGQGRAAVLHDEVEWVQSLHQQSSALARRLESLETLLLDGRRRV